MKHRRLSCERNMPYRTLEDASCLRHPAGGYPHDTEFRRDVEIGRVGIHDQWPLTGTDANAAEVQIDCNLQNSSKMTQRELYCTNAVPF
jgi:hypothetical protein